MPYRARYFFDWGAGVCFWAANDLTRDTFGYPVDHREIGLPPDLVEEVDRLLTWHVESLDRNDPGRSSAWNRTQENDFRRASADLVADLRRALGPRWEIVDESQR